MAFLRAVLGKHRIQVVAKIQVWINSALAFLGLASATNEE